MIGLPTIAAEQSTRHGYVAVPGAVYQYAGTPAMHMPTDVAVGPSGSVYVADGVNDRVLEFESDGDFVREIAAVGDRKLSRPVGIDVDAAGRLWIADTGNVRIVACDGGGAMASEIDLAESARTRAPDITDVVVSADGSRIWFADNDNHQIGFYEPATRVLSRFGGHGESLGQLQYPFMLAMSPGGDVFVTDVLNGRVQIFDATGRPAGVVGSYGVDLGDLYRPKGIAVDRAGDVWVSDGTLGVIQVFRPTRGLMDVVCDEQGKPLQCESPGGVALDRDGDLYVVELSANRVRRFAMTLDRTAPRAVAPPPSQQRAQPRTCTACHLEWMEPLVSGKATVLLSPPAEVRGNPSVSRASRCVTCHDASVVDSRRRVWVEHSHRENVEPPPTVKVPSRLPLVDGKIVCRTCHTAHARGGAGNTIAEAVFLRVNESPAELCIGCHEDKSAGAMAGMHPLGRMEQPVPEALREAGAHVPTGTHNVTCLVCHRGHGAASDSLLVMGTAQNALCLTCHEQLNPGAYAESAGELPHPLLAPLGDEQAHAAAQLGARHDASLQLMCVTCHRIHDAPSDRALLVFSLTDSHGCVACHNDKREVLSSPHDLGASFPHETNAHGETVETAGPCSACHMVHSTARPAEPGDLDPRGRCRTCHEIGRIAAAATLGPINHPDAACTDCHDPHRASSHAFLQNAPAKLCRECHDHNHALLGSPHDVTRAPELWPLESQEAGDQCLACHRPHGDAEHALWRLAPDRDYPERDAVCVVCHTDAAWNVSSAIAAVHSRTADPARTPASLPLISVAPGGTQIGCRTCHDPHGSESGGQHLLRIGSDWPLERLCINCHQEMHMVEFTGHASRVLRAAGLSARACAPCHAVHNSPDRARHGWIWGQSITEAVDDAAVANIDRFCRDCHRPGGPAGLPARFTHPAMPMVNPYEPHTSGYLPLYDGNGVESRTGVINCRTCHVPHGRPNLPLRSERADDLTPAERRAHGTQLRSATSPNLCTSCHGFDGMRRFLYFHEPERRAALPFSFEPPSIWKPRPGG
jgi:predicted CXXCH cytochrome family protein